MGAQKMPETLGNAPIDDPKIWALAEQSLALAEAIKPMLAGKGDDVQGAVLAELVSTWLGGYQDQAIRILAFEKWAETMLRMTEISTPWPND